MRHIFGYGDHSNDLKLLKYFEPTAFKMVDEAEDISKKECEKLSGRRAVFCGFEQDKVIYTGILKEIEKATFNIMDECGLI